MSTVNDFTVTNFETLFFLSSELVNTLFIGGDGSFRLSRNNKGGGEATDPSLFGDLGYYAPNEEYKAFCKVRGGAVDDQAVNMTVVVCDISN